MLCYKGGLGKSGKQQLQEVARYPSEVSNQYCGPVHPSLVLPFSKVHIKMGGCNTCPAKLVNTLSIPSDFPLALAFIQVLSNHMASLHTQNPGSGSSVQCSRALSVCLESLTKLITRLEMPQVLKERTLHLFSGVVWTFCATATDSVSAPALPNDFVQGLRHEALKLYELEAGKFTKGKQKVAYPPPGSVSEGGSGKFSTYFQALLECFLAATTYRQKFGGVESDIPIASSSSWIQLPSEPMKKSSVRRLRARRGAKKDVAESDPKRKEEWLNVVRSASCLLTSLTAPNSDSSESLPSTQLEASIAGSLPVYPNSRLIVVTGINPNLPINEAKMRIRRVCQSYGGLYKDQLYIPTVDVPPEDTETKSGGREGEEATGDTGGGGEGSEEQSRAEEHAQTEEDSTNSQSPAAEQRTEEEATGPSPRLAGHTVLELCCSGNVPAVWDSLLNLQPLQGEEGSLCLTSVTNTLVCTEDFQTPNKVLAEFLQQKLVQNGSLVEAADRALRRIYNSSSVKFGKKDDDGEKNEAAGIGPEISGDLSLFFSGCNGGKGTGREAMEAVWRAAVEDSTLSEETFLQWCRQQAEESAALIWQGLFASGYDLHFDRYVVNIRPMHSVHCMWIW